ncbi:LPXTG cell wall anchor domain-containing protein [Marinitenerispora sediminis]|uniref:Gram-positive cocci surface proteins LPxTG domain-containing protein n=1 Tax=Marinitenerispora sediminis TaxID=1931232 RepID=A0A368T1G6_9ACTN|nr:LPXTG cell wall anchor domain-containing protein [Marinitenerispora sediminis]RCV50939.1 hypothetical protein DEF23_21310 [Marinitenerispora sediminis]RCV51611.1 hypothetical protein DEF28_15060 [Marinitenerispora sediminis]RCV54272.1 hypothetical protein DEF24_19480 [Marinitenerispora sediminis]
MTVGGITAALLIPSTSIAWAADAATGDRAAADVVRLDNIALVSEEEEFGEEEGFDGFEDEEGFEEEGFEGCGEGIECFPVEEEEEVVGGGAGGAAGGGGGGGGEEEEAGGGGGGGGGEVGQQLPVTGAPVEVLAAMAAGTAVLGGGLMLAMRRRREAGAEL